MSGRNASTIPNIAFGITSVDLNRMIVKRDGVVTDLSRREVLILQTLLDAAETTVSAQDIYRVAWETRGAPEGRALTFAMRRLRTKIELDVKNPQYLLTVRGVGFRLVGATVIPNTEPPKTIHPEDVSLRKPTDDFVGRAEEMRVIDDFLHTQTRLLTVSGPGGTGKTRLVLELLYHQTEHKAVVLDLVDCTCKTDVLLLFSQRLGMVQQTSTDWATGVRRIVSTVGELHFRVLVLDNVDRCIEAVRELIETAIETETSIQFLVTSRELLRLAEEQTLRIGPLSPQEAEELFVRRAYRSTGMPSLSANQSTALKEISSELAECPLAIELAASRLAGLSLEGIRNRLGRQLTMLRRARRDVHPRQLTLRATLQWSWDLLPAAEQELLVACSVFFSGFDIELIQSVFGEVSEKKLLSQIENLVDKSLVIVGGGEHESRFSVPKGLRQFVLAKEGKQESLQNSIVRCTYAHLQTFSESRFVDLAVECHMLTSQQQVDWLTANIENILAAFRYGLTVNEVSSAWRLGRVAVMLMRRSQSIPSALEVIEDILTHSEKGSLEQIWATIERTGIYLAMGNQAQATNSFTVTDDTIEAISHPIWRQYLWLMKGALYRNKGMLEDAALIYRRIVDENVEDLGLLALRHHAMYQLEFSRRDWGAARVHLDALLRVYRQLDAALQEPRLMNDYTTLAGVQGQMSKAYRRAKEALRLATLYDDKQVLGHCLETLALITLKRGELDESVEFFEAAFAHRRTRGVTDYNVNLYINYANVLCLHGQEEKAIQTARTALSLAQDAKQIPSQIASLMTLGCLLMDHGESSEAEHLFRHGLQLSDSMGPSLYSTLLPLVLSISVLYQSRREESDILWSTHSDAAFAVLTADQVARLWYSRALAEIHAGNIEFAKMYLEKGSKSIEGMSERDIFECVWYREQIQSRLSMSR